MKLILFLIAWLVSVSTNAQETSETTNRPNSNNMSDSEFLKLAPEGVTVFPDLAYREGNEAWKLDLAMPTDRGKNAFPVIVYIHGGGWTQGDKRGQGIESILGYATKGFVSVSLNAHLALLLAICPPSAGMEGDGPYQEYSSMVQSAHCSSTPTKPRFGRGKGAGKDVTKMHAMSYVSAEVPPLSFIHGTADTIKAPVDHLDEFVQALREAGTKELTYKRYDDGTGHGAYVAHLEESRRSREEFFVRVLMK
ncbi:MAG: hypothetical protein O3C43_16480 [Verrucomicrobia bacterium]|nr:hypothetical protein [Verrucomicrobiota bacterium]MDA1068087.1 hypothetical protein [Verrucomicrobiota bacterium]